MTQPSEWPLETDDAIAAELMRWAASIDAEGDDLRPLLRRAAEALADREAQMKSVIGSSAKFADEIIRLRTEVKKLRKALKPFSDLFDSPQMGIHEHNGHGDKTLTIAGEGGHIRPKFDLYKALRRAREAMGEKGCPETT